MNTIEEAVKLNLGSRTVVIPGFKNVDIDAHPNVSIVANVGDLRGKVADNSVDEILASHVLEHFSHTKTAEVLREWRRCLKPVGVLWLSVPDFNRMLEIYTRHGMSDFVVNMLWGDQGYATAYHYTSFDFIRLEGLLKGAGYGEIERLAWLPFWKHGGCGSNVCTTDHRPVSLNCRAIKI